MSNMKMASSVICFLYQFYSERLFSFFLEKKDIKTPVYLSAYDLTSHPLFSLPKNLCILPHSPQKTPLEMMGRGLENPTYHPLITPDFILFQLLSSDTPYLLRMIRLLDTSSGNPK